MRIKFTSTQCRYLRRRAYRQLKPLLKLDTIEGEEARRLDAIWEKLLGWGTYSGKTVDLTKLNDLELILLEDEIHEFVDRTRGGRLKRTRISLRKRLAEIDKFKKTSVIDRLAKLT